VTDLIKFYWEVFYEEGLHKSIRGFSCRTDTRYIAPLCCKPPTFGPHESLICCRPPRYGPHESLPQYFDLYLEVLQHHCCIVKLKKCKWLLPSLQFVGVDIHSMGNALAASKFDSFREIPKLATWTDLNILIGMLGFYQKWIERYEIHIKPFRLIQTYRPKPSAFSIQEEMNLFQGFWLDEHDNVLHKLKSLILSSPILA